MPRIDAQKRSASSLGTQKLMKLNDHQFLMNRYSENNSRLYSFNYQGSINEEMRADYTFTTKWSEKGSFEYRGNYSS